MHDLWIVTQLTSPNGQDGDKNSFLVFSPNLTTGDLENSSPTFSGQARVLAGGIYHSCLDNSAPYPLLIRSTLQAEFSTLPTGPTTTTQFKYGRSTDDAG